MNNFTIGKSDRSHLKDVIPQNWVDHLIKWNVKNLCDLRDLYS